LQIPSFTMSKTDSSRGRKTGAPVVHSARVTPVAQLAEPAPIAPPQNLEAEESVLGAMLLSPGAIGAVSEALDASDFYRESHAKIYRAALALYARGEPVDAITLVDELEERSELEDAGGRVRIHELAALVPASANAGHYARIVREMATLRGLIRAGGEISTLGWDRPGEATDLVDRAEQIVFDLSQSRVTSEFSHIEELLKDSFERITALYEAVAEVTGSITMMEIRSKARRLKSREPDLGLIVVDYLQLMTSGSTVENRVQEVSQISRSLKILARDLDVPIVAMSQLSRAVEQRHD